MLLNHSSDQARKPVFVADMLQAASDFGSANWWLRIALQGVPLVESVGGGRVRVTFLWRESRADIDRILVDVNGITDHHSPTPQALVRIGDSDVWAWQVELPADWRGSYAFIPTHADDAPPPPDMPGREQAHRAWWGRIAAHACADPLNPLPSYPSGWGGRASPLHLSDAPDQGAWHVVDRLDQPAAPPEAFTWHSAIQRKSRTVWTHRTASDNSLPLPLVLLLDGRNWVERMPIAQVLSHETAEGRLRPAHYLLIDSIDGEQREQDLTPNPDFWAAIWDELVPIAADIAPISTDPADRIVAGQSYGGLAALYATLQWPEHWGGAIAQSPSLWWPDVDILRGGRRQSPDRALTERLRAGRFPVAKRRIFMEAGSREGAMVDVAQAMQAALIEADQASHYRTFEGGHDALCWRGGLIDGLRVLLPATQNSLQEDDA